MVLLGSVFHFHHDGRKGRSLLFFTVDSATANLANHGEDNTPHFHDSQGFRVIRLMVQDFSRRKPFRLIKDFANLQGTKFGNAGKLEE